MTPALPMPFSYELLHDRAESLHKHVVVDRSTSDRLDVLRILVRQCLDLPGDSRDLVHGIYREVFDLLLAVAPGATVDAAPLFQYRTQTERLLDLHTDLIERCLNEVTALAPTAPSDLPGDSRADLQRALEEVRQIRADFSEGFPVRTAEEVARARAESARGEGLELDDAFAEMAGCSRDEWLRRVAARRAAVTRP